MSAFFNNSTQGAMDGNIPNTPPILFVPRREDRARWEALSKELAALRGQLDQRRKSAGPDFDKWLMSATSEEIAKRIPTEGLRLHAALDEGAGKTIHLQV